MNPYRDYIAAKLYSAKGDVSKRWYAYYFVPHPETGKMVMKKKRKGMNRIKDRRKRKAFGNRLVKNINQLLAQGRLIQSKKKENSLTLIQHLEAVLKRFYERSATDKPTLTHESYIVYKSALNIFIGWLKKNNLEHLQPQQFTKQLALKYGDYMIEEKKYSGVTFNTRKVFLGVFFNALIEREIVSVNYFEKIKPLPETSRRYVPFTEKQLKQIDERLKKDKHGLWLFTRFILYLLMRGREITKIQLYDINTEKWVVLIYGDKGKTKIRRAPTVPLFLRTELKKIKRSYPGEYYLFGKGLVPGSSPITIKQVTRLFRKYVKLPLKIGKEQYMYGLKHTGIVRADAQGVSIKGIQQQAGHTTEKQTRDYMRGHGLIPNEEFAKMK